MKISGALLWLAALSHAAQLPLHAAEKPLEHVQADIGGFAGLQHEPPRKGAKAFRVPKQNKPFETFVGFVDGSRRTFAKYPGDGSDPDIVYELISHGAFPDYKLRLRKPSICDPDVAQYSGYLDISDDKHLFFWCVVLSCVLVTSGHFPHCIARRSQLSDSQVLRKPLKAFQISSCAVAEWSVGFLSAAPVFYLI
jgi:hypothetical protein